MRRAGFPNNNRGPFAGGIECILSVAYHCFEALDSEEPIHRAAFSTQASDQLEPKLQKVGRVPCRSSLTSPTKGTERGMGRIIAWPGSKAAIGSCGNQKGPTRKKVGIHT